MPELSGYSHIRVRMFCAERGVIRPDGRVMRLNARVLPESYRNTMANWLARGIDTVPLERWDALLMSVDMGLWEYEDWERDTFGNLSFREAATLESNDAITT